MAIDGPPASELTNQHFFVWSKIAVSVEFSSIELRKAVFFTIDKDEGFPKDEIVLPEANDDGPVVPDHDTGAVPVLTFGLSLVVPITVREKLHSDGFGHDY